VLRQRESEELVAKLAAYDGRALTIGERKARLELRDKLAARERKEASISQALKLLLSDKDLSPWDSGDLARAAAGFGNTSTPFNMWFSRATSAICARSFSLGHREMPNGSGSQILILRQRSLGHASLFPWRRATRSSIKFAFSSNTPTIKTTHRGNSPLPRNQLCTQVTVSSNTGVEPVNGGTDSRVSSGR
jgi:hypothetical protein